MIGALRRPSVSGWWAGPGPARAGLAGRLTQGERGQGAVGGRRAHGRAAARRGGLRGDQGPLPVELATSLRPPAGPPRPAACLAGLTASGRSNLARRKVSGLGAAGSVRLQRWPRAEPGPRPPGQASATAAHSPWSSHWLPRTARHRLRASNPRERRVAQSPRKSASLGLPAQSPRHGWDTPPAPPMSGAPGIGAVCAARAEALPVRREPIPALRTPRGPPSATQAQQPRHALSGSRNQLRTSGCSKRRPGNSRRLGGHCCRAPTTPGAILLPPRALLGQAAAGSRAPPHRARPQTRGPAPGHQGDVPEPISPASRRRMSAPPDRPATLPSNLRRLQTPAHGPSCQSSFCCLANAPLISSQPTPACLCPAPSSLLPTTEKRDPHGHFGKQFG